MRLNASQNIYFNNVLVDNVYINNELIWQPSYFISNDGIDASNVSGDENNPFQTLNYAISRITNQNRIYFKSGSYEFDEKEITNTGLSIQGYNNQSVTFDGTKPISDL